MIGRLEGGVLTHDHHFDHHDHTLRAAIICLESDNPVSAAEVEASIPAELGIAHLSVELRAPRGRRREEF